MYTLRELLEITSKKSASDLHLTVGASPIARVDGKLVKLSEEIILAQHTEMYAKDILREFYDEFMIDSDYDTVYSIDGLGRFRVNIFRQKNNIALAIRVIANKIATLDELNHPDVLKELSGKTKGLILVTGATGSGKSTTLAAMINEINNSRNAHIITIEDPIEFLHQHNKCIVNQREIGRDTKNYERAMKSILREDPDVILVGEMRDLETVSFAITAAETGHLVFSTLHTNGAVKTIDRIIDLFPPYQQQQIRVQLSTILVGVISQQLVPTINGKRIAALEIMINTPAIQNMIRDGKNHQIELAIQTGSKYNMKTMDMSLLNLYNKGKISSEIAINYSVDKDIMSRNMLY